MEANPGATGQNVVDHDTEQDMKRNSERSIKTDELLNNPILP